MKTTVVIDEELLEDAKKLLKTVTIVDTVHASLQFVKRQHQLGMLADALGTIDLDLTPEGIRRQRRKRTPRAAR